MTSQEIDITTENQILKATLFQPDSQKAKKSAIMIAPATGIKRQFYQAFASFLADAGYVVISFDNDGIGQSKQGSVKKSKASLISWGQVDMPAVLQYLQQHFPNYQYHLIGHSAGGQLFGLMPNHHQLTSVFNVACSSGCIKNMAMPYRAKAMFFMDIFIPINNWFYGYCNSQWVGMGEPLPKQVAEQWREWCNGQGYIKTAFGKTVNQHYYHDVTLPAMWVIASDDDIANEKNMWDMIAVFPNMQTHTKILIPSEYGLSQIGHMKFFSRQSKVLWQQALDWLDKF